jgi:hypothetical protein
MSVCTQSLWLNSRWLTSHEIIIFILQNLSRDIIICLTGQKRLRLLSDIQILFKQRWSRNIKKRENDLCCWLAGRKNTAAERGKKSYTGKDGASSLPSAVSPTPAASPSPQTLTRVILSPMWRVEAPPRTSPASTSRMTPRRRSGWARAGRQWGQLPLPPYVLF